MRTFTKYISLFLLTLLPAVAQVSFDFSTPVQLAPVQTPGKWYPDRFPPNGFFSPAVAPNGFSNSLEETIAAGDLQACAGVPCTSFYNTQGRKFDIPATSTSVTIALYVPAAWATENARKAGFWLTAFDNLNNVGDFPIIEFQGPITSPPANGPGYDPNGGVPGFYGWNNVTSHFDFIGLPAGFTYNTFVQLTITLVLGAGGHFVYTVGSPSTAVSIISPLSDPTDTGFGTLYYRAIITV